MKFKTLIVVLIALVYLSFNKYDEYTVKFVMITKILHYVDWPKETLSEKDEIRFGMYGTNPFGSLVYKYAKTRTIKEKELAPTIIDATISNIENIDILFISGESKSKTSEIIKKTNQSKILIITDCSGCANKEVC